MWQVRRGSIYSELLLLFVTTRYVIKSVKVPLVEVAELMNW